MQDLVKGFSQQFRYFYCEGRAGPPGGGIYFLFNQKIGSFLLLGRLYLKRIEQFHKKKNTRF